MTKSEIELHLSSFDEGAIRITSRAGYDKYGSLGPDGGFVLPKSEFDAILSQTGGNMRLVEQKLGLSPGYLNSNDMLVAYIEPKNMSGLRVPSGNEPGANPNWIPGGYTSRGVSEGVMDFSLVKEFRELSLR